MMNKSLALKTTFKKGDVVGTTAHHLKGSRYELVVRFNQNHKPMWAAYEAGKPKIPAHGVNLRESTLIHNFEIDYTSLTGAELLVKVIQRDAKAIFEYIKRYKKPPNLPNNGKNVNKKSKKIS